MQKRFIILVLVVVGIVGTILAGLLLKGDSATPVDTATPSGTSPGAQTNTGTNGSFSGDSGTDLFTIDSRLIRARNFLNDSTTKENSQVPGTYFLGYHKSQGLSDPTADDNAPYVVQYTEATDSFVIALYKEPIGLVREDMQRDLTDRLGIEESDMCRLKYSVTTPWWANQVYAGRDLRFSFCPGATELP